MKGLDYSAGRPSAAAVKAAGYGFVVRYLAYLGSRPKYITAAESADMLEAGVAIALVFESTAGRALSGRDAGVSDARTAKASARAVGQPADRPIYFAVDQDVTAAQMPAVDAYLAGVASVIGAARVGVYGEFDVIEHCAEKGTARWFWQTHAWSHGKTSPRAHLIQELGTVHVDGIECDVNTAKTDDFGQWPTIGDTDDMQANELGPALNKELGGPADLDLWHKFVRMAAEGVLAALADPRARASLLAALDPAAFAVKVVAALPKGVASGLTEADVEHAVRVVLADAGKEG